MTLRTGHGNGKGTPRVEVLPVDELPVGIQAPASPVPPRDAAGRLLPTPRRKRLQASAARHRTKAVSYAGCWGCGHPRTAMPMRLPSARLRMA
jgi:hypothetical protein